MCSKTWSGPAWMTLQKSGGNKLELFVYVHILITVIIAHDGRERKEE